MVPCFDNAGGGAVNRGAVFYLDNVGGSERRAVLGGLTVP